ncbi:MAG TPA: MFS transporter [Anaerolineaceae bacterium]|nr:MFS transporter [Anaerolineaceae bacterium]HOQ69390.1 MFS transporter [Anaerolineaceae bacterium]
MLNMDFKKIAQEFPRKFWSVVGVSFIDRVGGTMLFPFFALYITQKFHVGMTQAGVVLGLFSVFGLVGQMIGGALTDKFGRRKLIIFGLVFSAISTLAFGFINTFSALIPLAIGVGLLSDIAGPAHAAMIADILPENQRQEGFGILRVVGNLAWIFGPTIGGFVAGKSFLALFIIDAVISSLVALLFYLLIPETKPQNQPGEKPESLLVTFKGYFQVLRHGAFIAFMAAGMLMGLVYQQMYHSLSVYLRDNHGIDPKGYGFLLTASAIVVILFQFSMTRWIKKKPAFKMMALGTLFYMLGFSMFGFVGQYWLFVLAIMIITTGEMIVVPTSQALAVNFATEDMRGRYMGVFGITWMLPATIGPGAAGLILDHFNPNLLWYIGGALCAISALAYYGLHLKIGAQERFQPAQDEPAAVEDPAV